MTLMELYNKARSLPAKERKELVKMLVDSLEADEPKKTYSILEFRGIAAHLADDEDPQEYINRMRDEWDKRP